MTQGQGVLSLWETLWLEITGYPDLSLTEAIPPALRFRPGQPQAPSGPWPVGRSFDLQSQTDPSPGCRPGRSGPVQMGR